MRRMQVSRKHIALSLSSILRDRGLHAILLLSAGVVFLAYPLGLAPGLFINIGDGHDQAYIRNFYDQEQAAFPFRWTKDGSTIRIPELGCAPASIRLSAAGARSEGARLPTVTIRGNDEVIAEFVVQNEMAAYEFAYSPLRPCLLPRDLTLQLRSDTFVPPSGDSRTLGILVNTIEVTPRIGILFLELLPVSLTVSSVAAVSLALCYLLLSRIEALRPLSFACCLAMLILLGVGMALRAHARIFVPLLVMLLCFAGVFVTYYWRSIRHESSLSREDHFSPLRGIYRISPSTIAEIVIDACLVTAFSIFTVLLANGQIVFGSKSGHWVYHYLNSLSATPIFMSFLIIPSVLALAHLTQRLISSRGHISIICLWFCLAFVLQLCIHSLYPYSIEAAIQSDYANSFYSPATEYGASELIRNFNSISSSLPLHAESNMPGKILFFHVLTTFTSSPRLMGYLILLFSNAGALLTYHISNRLFGDHLIATYSFILYFFIPAKLFFFPLLNTVSPVFMLLSLLFLIEYLESRKDLYLILLGSSIYLILLFDPLPLVSGIIFTAILAKYYLENKIDAFRLLKIGLLSSLSFFLIHVIVLLGFGYDIINSLLGVVRFATAFYTMAESERGYSVWIVPNLKDFFVNVGFTQGILFLALVAVAFAKTVDIWSSSVNRTKDLLRFILAPGPLMAVSLTIALLVLDISGVNRGEVARLWMFLMVYVQMIASYSCVTHLGKVTFYLVLAATILQTTITISMVGFVIP